MIKYIRQPVSLFLTLLMVLPAAFGQQSITSQITAMPTGTKIELRLNDGKTMRGARGPLSDAGFTLVTSNAGARQIAFNDVASVKQLKSHTTRNVLIGVGIGVAALGITAGIIFRCGGLGCGNRF
jgi:hypothetical protein